MSKLNPYDLNGMRKAAEHSKGAYDCDKVKRLERELEAEGNNRFVPYRIGEKTPEPAPDLLSLADSLAEAARKTNWCMDVYVGAWGSHHKGHDQEESDSWDALSDALDAQKAAVSAYSAARGRVNR